MTEKNVFDIKDFKPPAGSPSGRTLAVGLAVLLVLLMLSSQQGRPFYTIAPEEVGVVLRLGRFVDTTTPGFHFKLPLSIDKVYKVPIQRQLTAEFGFRTPGLRVHTEVAREDPKRESSMLTGDLNAAVVDWVVQYRIVDPYLFLFRVRNVELTFRDMSEAVMREVVGDRTVNEVITIGRQEVTMVALEKLQELCDRYETGIKVDQVVLQDVTPPDPVKPAFNEVNQAEQERERLINQAQSEYNKAVPRARGEAEQRVLAAEGYATNRVNSAMGEAARFGSLYEEYRKAPDVTRQRLYLETLGNVLPNTGRKIVVDDDLEGVVPLLNLPQGLRGAPAAAAGGGGS